jgi:hypothetical protein
MTHSAGRAWKRVAALLLAGALAVAGLWLAVGAGAKGGTSARDAAYPVTYSYKTKIDDVKFGKVASTNSNKVRFKFHVKSTNGSPLSSVQTECKLDDSHYKKCDSPKKYRHLNKGKHKFRVKATYKRCTGCNDASKPDSYAWKVK